MRITLRHQIAALFLLLQSLSTLSFLVSSAGRRIPNDSRRQQQLNRRKIGNNQNQPPRRDDRRLSRSRSTSTLQMVDWQVAFPWLYEFNSAFKNALKFILVPQAFKAEVSSRKQPTASVTLSSSSSTSSPPVAETIPPPEAPSIPQPAFSESVGEDNALASAVGVTNKLQESMPAERLDTSEILTVDSPSQATSSLQTELFDSFQRLKGLSRPIQEKGEELAIRAAENLKPLAGDAIERSDVLAREFAGSLKEKGEELALQAAENLKPLARDAIERSEVLAREAVQRGGALSQEAAKKGAVISQEAVRKGAVLTQEAALKGAALTQEAAERSAVLARSAGEALSDQAAKRSDNMADIVDLSSLRLPDVQLFKGSEVDLRQLYLDKVSELDFGDLSLERISSFRLEDVRNIDQLLHLRFLTEEGSLRDMRFLEIPMEKLSQLQLPEFDFLPEAKIDILQAPDTVRPELVQSTISQLQEAYQNRLSWIQDSPRSPGEAPTLLVYVQENVNWNEIQGALVFPKETFAASLENLGELFQSDTWTPRDVVKAINLEELGAWYVGAAGLMILLSTAISSVSVENQRLKSKRPQTSRADDAVSYQDEFIANVLADQKEALQTEVGKLSEVTAAVLKEVSTLKAESASKDYEIAMMRTDFLDLKSQLSASMSGDLQLKLALEQAERKAKEQARLVEQVRAEKESLQQEMEKLSANAEKLKVHLRSVLKATNKPTIKANQPTMNSNSTGFTDDWLFFASTPAQT